MEAAETPPLVAILEQLSSMNCTEVGPLIVDHQAGDLAIPLNHWRELLELVSVRRSLSPGGPVLTALVGPTGAGKSTILNLALGERLAVPGAIRPTTSQPLGVASDDVRRFYQEDPFLATDREMVFAWTTPGHQQIDLQNHALLDTPDFDSVEENNRSRAWRLLLRADRVVLVLNPEKYGDAAVERTLKQLQGLGSVVGCVFNKMTGTAPFEDCRQRLLELGFPPPLGIPRLADPDNCDPDAADGEGSELDASLRSDLLQLLSPRKLPDGWLERRLHSAERLETELRTGTIEPWVLGSDKALDDLQGSIDQLEAELPARIARQIPLELDEALRVQMIQRLEAQVRRFDPLREPRRWIRESLGRLFGKSRSDRSEQDPLKDSSWLTDSYRDRHLELQLAVHQELTTLFDAARAQVQPPFPFVFPGQPDNAEMHTKLAAVVEGVCTEIAAEADRLTQELSMGNKVTFFGSQAAVHTLMLLLFVKTGGLSPTELIAQGMLSPLLARMAEKLVSSGELAAVEKRLQEHFNAELCALFRTMTGDASMRLSKLREQHPTTKEWHDAVDRWKGSGA